MIKKSKSIFFQRNAAAAAATLSAMGSERSNGQTGGEFNFLIEASVTRFGDLLYFVQLFKAFGNN